MENDKYLDNKDAIIAFMKKVIEMHPDYIVQDDIIHRFNKRYKLRDYILFVLKEFPDGLHFSEINKKIHEMFGVESSDRRVHMNLTHFPWLFMNIGLWLYTLKSNTKYSSEKIWDLIYLFLKECGEPKNLKEISDYVLSRKKIEENTVRAVFDYANEFRFVFLDDWRIGLKEWWLSNLRKKKEVNKYNISLSKGLDLLIKNNELPKSFTINELITLFDNKFWDDVSKNKTGYSTLLLKKMQDWRLTCNNSGHENIYFLI